MKDFIDVILDENKIINQKSFQEIRSLSNNEELILFGDNIIECFTVLNQTLNQNHCNFVGVYFYNIHSPVYVFELDDKHYLIKGCGYHDRWLLPDSVHKYISFHDVPDAVLYSIN